MPSFYNRRTNIYTLLISFFPSLLINETRENQTHTHICLVERNGKNKNRIYFPVIPYHLRYINLHTALHSSFSYQLFHLLPFICLFRHKSFYCFTHISRAFEYIMYYNTRNDQTQTPKRSYTNINFSWKSFVVIQNVGISTSASEMLNTQTEAYALHTRYAIHCNVFICLLFNICHNIERITVGGRY